MRQIWVRFPVQNDSKMITRREFRGSSAGALALRLGWLTKVSASQPYSVTQKFQSPLKIPNVLHPIKSDETTDYYEIEQRHASVEVLPGKHTVIWGYEGMFPGPTIKVRQNRRTAVRHTNKLDVPTVVHLHGGATPSDSDGFPTDLLQPGHQKTYFYPNDRAATLWYHDHTMDQTGRNIFMGLAGMYIVEGEEEKRLPLPLGEFDVPLILQDRLFSPDGAILYRPDPVDGPAADVTLINGTPWPRLDVSACKYRFRILNASNARSFRLALTSRQRFIQIATDGGLLPAPIVVQEIPLAMAERAEVILDFSIHPLKANFALEDLNASPAQRFLLQFNVVRRAEHDSKVPERLSGSPSIVPHPAAHRRNFVFTRGNSRGSEVRWSINGKEFDPDHAIAEVSSNDTEIWRLANHSFRDKHNVVHPIHLHLANFQILRRNGDSVALYESGLKDTVALNVGDEVEIAVRFPQYKGRYLFHCHNLEHEDRGMMARFDVR
jgi:spore coat protein A